MKNNKNIKQTIKDFDKPLLVGDKVYLGNVLLYLWATRMYIIKVTLFMGLLGLFLAFATPKKYSCVTKILPSVDSQADNFGGLSSLAGLAGINIGGLPGSSNTILTTDIFPEIVESYNYMNELIKSPVYIADIDSVVSPYQYLLELKKPSFGEIALKYTIKLPWTLKTLLTRSNKVVNMRGQSDKLLITMSQKEMNIHDSFKKNISLSVDRNTGLVIVEVVSPEPIMAAQITTHALRILQEYIIEFKTKQAQENLNFIDDIWNKKKFEYAESQKSYYDYLDSHRNLITERGDLEFQELKDQMEIDRSIFSEISHQKEQARIALKQETPNFSIIEPPIVPIEKSSPKRMLILITSTFLGLFFGVVLSIGVRAFIIFKITK